MRNKKIIRLAFTALVSIMLMSAISFAERKVKNSVIQEVKIDVESTAQGQFITDIDILDRLNDFYAPSLEGSQTLDLNVLVLDSLVESSPFVRKAEVFSNLDGNLYVDVEQEVPLIRIINNKNSSYYINMQGHKMPLSMHRTAKVTVANGNIKEELYPTDSFTSQTLKDLYAIAQFLDKNEFFKALTAQLFVATNGDIVLITKQEERHDIILGNAENLENKFENLFLFYTKVLSVKGWDAYQTINLKYKNQIVAKK